MPNNNWDITKPIDHLKIGDVPASIRDVTSSSKLVIAKEHETPGTDNAGGQHVRGSARVYLSDAVAVTDPEGNGLDTTSTTDDGRIHVNTSASNELRVYVATAAGITTGWEHIRVGRVKASTEIDANSRGVVNVASGTQTGQVIHVGQIDTTALTGQLRILVPATTANVGVSVLDPPTADEHIASKKYVDAVPDAEGTAPTRNDSDTNAMLVAHAYQAQTAGVVTAFSTADSAAKIQAYIDNTDDPAGAGTEMSASQTNAAGSVPCVTMFVPKDMYFEITCSAACTIAWTSIVTGGAAPIDQD